VMATLLLVALLRLAVVRWVGAAHAYAVWWVLPCAIAAWCVATAWPAAAVVTTAKAPLVAWQAAKALPSAALGQTPSVWAMLLVVWALGALAFAVLLVGAQLHLRRSLGALSTGELTGQDPRVRYCAHANAGPLALGLLRPRIVLPADFAQRYTATEQSLALAHEQIHIARGDLWVNAGMAALQLTQWFNPLAHWAAQALRRDQELSCDARVLQPQTGLAAAYANAVLKSSSPALAIRWPASAALATPGHTPNALKERLMRMNDSNPSPARRWTATSLIALAGAVAAYSAWANASPTPKAGEYKIQVLYHGMKVSSNASEAVHKRSSFSLITAEKQSAGFVTDPVDGSRCEMSLTPTEQGPNQVSLQITQNCGQATQPVRMVVELGGMASMGRSFPGSPWYHNFTFVVTRGV
jgi:bla regulator protein blaR1